MSTRRVSREFTEFREQYVIVGHDGLPDYRDRRAKKKMKKKRRLNRIRPMMGPLLNGIRFVTLSYNTLMPYSEMYQ